MQIANRTWRWPGLLPAVVLATACGPVARIPVPVPVDLPDVTQVDDSAARLARRIAPVLYLQRDEQFHLERVVAVVHPFRRLIAYHLLWRDDVHGAWLPFTIPTDQEIVWVGYDETGAVTDLWTYWHGHILHADWRERGFAAVDVQWGKHGSLPRNMIHGSLPPLATMNVYYALTWIGLPDILLSALQRPGPRCMCRSYARYREHTNVLPVAGRIDVVVRAEDPAAVLSAVFGRPYSRKRAWPQSVRPASESLTVR